MMLGFQFETDTNDLMLGMNLPTSQNEFMLGGFKDSMKNAGKWFKKVGKRVINVVPKAIELISKNKDLVKTITNTLPINPSIKNIVNKTLDKVELIKKPAQFLDKWVNRDVVAKTLENVHGKISLMNDKDLLDRVTHNSNMIMSNLGKTDDMSEKEAKQFMRDLKYIPLISTGPELAGVKGNFITLRGKELGAICNYKTKKLDSKYGRMFLGEIGALEPRFMISAITPSKGKPKAGVRPGAKTSVKPSIVGKDVNFSDFFK